MNGNSISFEWIRHNSANLSGFIVEYCILAKGIDIFVYSAAMPTESIWMISQLCAKRIHF